MESIRYSFDHAEVFINEKADLQLKLVPEIERVKAAWGAGYDTDYASLSLPSDTELLKRIMACVDYSRECKARMIVIIGIGGSNLGAMALLQALGHDTARSVHFADTVDAPYSAKIYDQAEQMLRQGDEVLLIVISKSGSTTETVANAQLFTALLQQYRTDYARNIVVISDEESPLAAIAQQQHFYYLPIPAQVGGRYSVFSAVGLFPLAMMGVDIEALRRGAESMKGALTNLDLHENPAALSAATLYHFYHRGLVIHDTFAFSHALYGIGQWYRQLLAESIGKAETRDGKTVHVGITPTTSIGSVDLHSVTQLALAGPANRITTFLAIEHQKDIAVPSGTPFDSLAPMIQGTSFDTIMEAILKGTQKAYDYANRPFMTIELPEISAYHCGQLLQMKMVEIMYLGFLFDIDPFNQPQVEWYKKETRKILAYE